MRSRHLAVLAALSSYGCATGHFGQVSFAGEGSSPPGKATQSQTVHVVRNAQMTDTVLETRIRRKVETFLLSSGHVLAGPDVADVYVLATFGTGRRLVVTEASVFRPEEVAIVRDRQGNAVRRQFTPARMESRRVPTYENSVWLQLLSSDARYFRETGMVRNFWRGEAAMKGTPESIHRAAPYLIVPALRYFGQGTRAVITMDVRAKDAAWSEPPP